MFEPVDKVSRSGLFFKNPAGNGKFVRGGVFQPRLKGDEKTDDLSKLFKLSKLMGILPIDGSLSFSNSWIIYSIVACLSFTVASLGFKTLYLLETDDFRGKAWHKIIFYCRALVENAIIVSHVVQIVVHRQEFAQVLEMLADRRQRILEIAGMTNDIFSIQLLFICFKLFTDIINFAYFTIIRIKDLTTMNDGAVITSVIRMPLFAVWKIFELYSISASTEQLVETTIFYGKIYKKTTEKTTNLYLEPGASSYWSPRFWTCSLDAHGLCALPSRTGADPPMPLELAREAPLLLHGVESFPVIFLLCQDSKEKVASGLGVECLLSKL
ncbi:unnamed protein product [Nesidiocoris tenuis]|uniref:Uncharacterized protein n=1 Tax=Nesidiocoris tenuis TaxID=355587 RepID=A0A6H5HKF1_9HEMI|nr:unnamed protein product [Nesidiocoris tenuis]